MPKRLSRQEIERFLCGRHVAVLGTLGEDGAPVLTPIWYLFDGGQILMRTDAAGAKTRNIERDPRVSVCVQDERAPYKSVTAYGTATVEPAREDLATRMPRHYLGFIGEHRLPARRRGSRSARPRGSDARDHAVEVPDAGLHAGDAGRRAPVVAGETHPASLAMIARRGR